MGGVLGCLVSAAMASGVQDPTPAIRTGPSEVSFSDIRTSVKILGAHLITCGILSVPPTECELVATLNGHAACARRISRSRVARAQIRDRKAEKDQHPVAFSKALTNG